MRVDCRRFSLGHLPATLKLDVCLKHALQFIQIQKAIKGPHRIQIESVAFTLNMERRRMPERADKTQGEQNPDAYACVTRQTGTD
jgi:hypothetical protein